MVFRLERITPWVPRLQTRTLLTVISLSLPESKESVTLSFKLTNLIPTNWLSLVFIKITPDLAYVTNEFLDRTRIVLN